jgi:FkbM family methyltransferase
VKGFMKKASHALALLLTDPHDFWMHLKPYIVMAKSGIILLNGVHFNIDLDLDPYMMRCIYAGTYEYKIMNILKKLLKNGDTFIDVGANIGYVSAFALSLVGKTGEVHSFEPVPRYLKRLQALRDGNPDFQLYVNDFALGAEEGISSITTSINNIGWNTMVPDFMSKDEIKEEIKIDVSTLNNYCFKRNIQKPRVVKIDTEGYEFPVMMGFQQYLLRVDELPIIIIEVGPSAYSKLKLSLTDFACFMANLGYEAFDIKSMRLVEIAKLEETTDVVFLPKHCLNILF